MALLSTVSRSNWNLEMLVFVVFSISEFLCSGVPTFSVFRVPVSV